eukprot:5124198-Amphidinium_carterae.3
MALVWTNSQVVEQFVSTLMEVWHQQSTTAESAEPCSSGQQTRKQNQTCQSASGHQNNDCR